MAYAVTVHYTEPLIRRTVRNAYLRALGWYLPIPLLTGLLCGWLLALGDHGWLTGALGGVTYTQAISFYRNYHFRLRTAQYLVRRVPTATIRFDAETIFLESPTTALRLPWHAIKQVVRLREVWLLFYETAYLMLPTADLNDEVCAFLIEQVKLHGGRIT